MTLAERTVDWIARARSLALRVENFVDGSWEAARGDDAIAKYSPRDGQLLYHVPAGHPEDVHRAVANAKTAFNDGRWALLPVARRKEVLRKLANLLRAHRDEFALRESLDVGKPIGDSFGFDVDAAAESIDFSGEAADKFYGKFYAADASSLSYQLLRPVGVVGAIVGWNFPLVLAAGKIGPALAAGNSVVLKPSEFTSLSASALAELAIEAGVPPGVFNVVTGGPPTGAALAGDPSVDLLTFTGSTKTGKEIMIASGRSNMKRLILECGGKAPNIVFDDCPDLEPVADAVVARAFYNQGEVCAASSRLLVQEGIKDSLVREVIRKAGALTPGDPLLLDTKYGALVNDAHERKVKSYIEHGLTEGATVVYQSDAPRPLNGGFYMGPLIFDRVRPGQRIAQEEIFGPVLSVISFRDEEEALRIANGTIYGLSAIVWTKDIGRAHRVTQAMRAGWVVINATPRPGAGPRMSVLSIGGHKQSGFGLEGGLEGIEQYTSRTAVQWFV